MKQKIKTDKSLWLHYIFSIYHIQLYTRYMSVLSGLVELYNLVYLSCALACALDSNSHGSEATFTHTER